MNKYEIKFRLEKRIPVLLETNHDKYINFEKLRKKFVEDYPIDKILNLEIDDYVIGKGRKDSFCYRVERELDPLGRILGARADKFGIYYGKVKSDPILEYRFVPKFGAYQDEAFNNVKDVVKIVVRQEWKNDPVLYNMPNPQALLDLSEQTVEESLHRLRNKLIL